MPQLNDIIILGLSITSSWGNGHARTYRSLIKGLHELGHRVLFLEREQPWYAAHRDLRQFPYGDVRLYSSLEELETVYAPRIRAADAVIVGSFVPDGVRVSRWVLGEARGVRAYYDIDTAVTLARLRTDSCEYMSARLIPEFDLLLSMTGGPMLARLEAQFGAKRACALYGSVDVEAYRPEEGAAVQSDLAYMGTYSEDRQPKLERLLCEPARAAPTRQFRVVGAQYPATLRWPKNVRRIDHLLPADEQSFYSSQRYMLNLTRDDMVEAGYSPSLRLFEAAACGVPIISDHWPGIEEFFMPGEEVLLATSGEEVLGYLTEVDEQRRANVANAARERVVTSHSSLRRAQQLDEHLASARMQLPPRVPRPATRPRAAMRR